MAATNAATLDGPTPDVVDEIDFTGAMSGALAGKDRRKSLFSKEVATGGGDDASFLPPSPGHRCRTETFFSVGVDL